MNEEVKLEDIVSLCKRRGFIYQGSELYGGLAGTWDYGPLGAQLKKNVIDEWWKFFIEDRNDMLAIDTTILMNAKVWQASGHVDTFNDPLIECNNCHSRFRADKIDTSKCPNCGKMNTFGQPRKFNLLFKTQVGPIEDEKSLTYLRGETAQGMFVNFKNVLDSYYPDIPFGIAQVGRAFRNEISPRDFIFRTREFEIMELEYFIKPESWEEFFNHWHDYTNKWFELIGLNKERLKLEEVEEADRAHYSKRTIDFLFNFPSLGFDEIAGLAYRTDFDLSNHQKFSGKNLAYRPKDGSKAFVPHVIEPTYGLDRHILAILSQAYSLDQIKDEKRIYLNLPSKLSPIKIAVFPLLKNKPDLVNKSKNIFNDLKGKYKFVMWDDNGNIGKRYRRQDEIGTPYCITVDYETLENNSVTLRDRNSTNQKRVNINSLNSEIKL